jgi:hypothetical protein
MRQYLVPRFGRAPPALPASRASSPSAIVLEDEISPRFLPCYWGFHDFGQAETSIQPV